MARSNNNLNAVLKDTADAIRVKKGTSEPIVPRDFADEIESIQTGGGGSGSDIEVQLLTGQLMSYTVPSGVAQLKSFCFYYDGGLKNIDFNQARIVPYSGFANCSNLSRAVGNEIRRLDYNAFSSCAKLIEASFPKLVMAAPQAFAYCSNLQSVYFPELVFVGQGLFGGCSALSKANLPNLIFAGEALFSNCSNLESISLPNLMFASSLVAQPLPKISGTFNLPNLMLISGGVFQNFSNVTGISTFAINFGSGSYVFRNCYELENLSVQIGYGSIRGSAFYNCYKLPNFSFPLVFPDGDQSTFYNCSALSQITMDGGRIGASTFYNCSSLESLYFLGASTTVPQLGNINAFQNTPMSNSAYLGHYGSIYVPSAMVASFKAATNWITYSNRITALPSEFDSKFAYAYEFYSNIYSSLTAIPSEKQNVEYVLRYAFWGCTNLEVVDLPNCKSIGSMAFSSPKISSISLPNCEFIGSNAFYSQTNMSLLTSLDLPKVKYIEGSFMRALNVSNINLPECLYLGSYALFGMQQSCSFINCPNVKCIDQFAFSGFTLLTSINLPERLFMSSGAFSGCWRLENISVPKLKYIDGGAFYGCNRLTNFSAPELAFISGFNTFAGCYSLESFYAPKLMSITGYCFQSTKISTFDFTNIASIGQNAFAYCAQLEKININCASIIEMGTFANCVQMSKALLQANVVAINNGDNFSNCQKLESVYMFAKVPVSTSMSTAFRNCPIASDSYLSGRYGSIYVPASLVSAYQNHSVWSWYRDRFVGMTDEEMQSIIDHWDD